MCVSVVGGWDRSLLEFVGGLLGEVGGGGSWGGGGSFMPVYNDSPFNASKTQQNGRHWGLPVSFPLLQNPLVR